MVNINWTVYQENIAILGMQGTGKTTLATKILDGIPRVNRIIISPINKQSWLEYGQQIDRFEDLAPGAYLWTGPDDRQAFEKLCSIILDKIPNCVVIVDDIQEYVSKMKIPRPLNSLIQSGRNRGICSIWLSPSPNLVSNFILQSAQHIFSFRMNLDSQIEWLEKNYYGPDAYLLLPPERRRKAPTMQFEGILPKHAYLYRHYMSEANELHIPEGAAP